MANIRTRIRVDPDHRISGTAPDTVPVGEHEATITIVGIRAPRRRQRIDNLPTHDEPWDDSVSLHREDIYGNDGR